MPIDVNIHDKQAPKNEFLKYGLSKPIIEALTLLDYIKPTEIQEKVIPLVLSGKNIAACSQTGTGKTAAFAVPICEMAVWEDNLAQALVLEPSRELAVQVSNEIFNIGRRKRLKVPAVFGGFPIDKQVQTLKQKTHIVVGTPGRTMDLIRRGSLKLSNIKYLVIDEADLMLDMGFIDEVKEISALLPKDRVTMLFSATLEKGVQNLTEEAVTDAVFVSQTSADEKIAGSSIKQIVYKTDSDNKYADLKRVLMKQNPESCMIFCGTREMVNVLFQKLRRDRIFCGMIHGEMEQRERLKNIDAFKRGGFRYLIATDVAARGIDFDDITLVINYDFPTGRETYVHRIGRTGRNGKSGLAVSFVTDDEVRMLERVEEYTSLRLPICECLDLSDEEEKEFWQLQRKKSAPKESKGTKLNKTIMRLSIGGGRKSKMRAGDIVGAICSIDGVVHEDIGVIDVRESITYVEILNQKGQLVLEQLQTKAIKGKLRKVRASFKAKS